MWAEAKHKGGEIVRCNCCVVPGCEMKWNLSSEISLHELSGTIDGNVGDDANDGGISDTGG